MMPNTVRFLLFLLLTATVYNSLPRQYRLAWLLFVSCAYYATWSIPYLLCLFATSAIAYFAGLRLEAKPDIRVFSITIAILLSNLLFFKYFLVLAPRGWFTLAAPIGISYYTFKLLSYVIDVYWGKMPAERNFMYIALFSSFFPQIPSGPIARASQFLPQLNEGRSPNVDQIVLGLRLILFGWFQKEVVADGLGAMLQGAHETQALRGWPMLVYIYAQVWRLYADFSGITDIAIGAANLFGFTSPQNFASPFYAANIQEFWRRWHMSLTTWLTDYLFKPLLTVLRDLRDFGMHISLMITLLSVALWHGPKLNFLIFGLINGIYMIVSAATLPVRNRIFKKYILLSHWRKFFGPLITFNLVAFSFVFFSTDNVPGAWSMIQSVFSPNFISPDFSSRWLRPTDLLLLAASLLIMEVIHVFKKSPIYETADSNTSRLGVLAFYAALATLFLLVHPPAREFIYFRF